MSGAAAAGTLGAGHRAGDPRPAQDAHEDVLRLRAVLRRSAQHPHLPGLPGAARRAAGAQRPRGGVRDHDRPRAGLRDRAALAVSPQELLLSRLAQGVPDLPVRRARCAAAAASATCGSTASTSRRTRPSSSTSGESGRIHGSDRSVVDFNRCGTPLVEIVTEPDLNSPEQAHEWLTLLRTTLRQLGVSDVNMEEGSLRADANVSVRPVGSRELGTKTELKNMNSFRFLERGVRAEIERQSELLRGGRAGRSGDASLRPRLWPADLAALQGGGARLPLLPRARSGPARRHRGRAARRPRARSPSSPRRALSALRPSSAWPPNGPASWPSGASWATTSRRRWPRPAAAPDAATRSPTGSRSSSSGSAPTPTRPTAA